MQSGKNHRNGAKNWKRYGLAALVGVAGLIAIHLMMGRWRSDFEADANTKPQKYFRIANEVPTLLMIFIVLLAILKPW